MHDRDGWIWLDGTWVAWREAKIHVLTHTLHYGNGVFEGIRTYMTEKGAAVFRLSDHIDRLHHSAHIVGMKIPYSKSALERVCVEAIEKNALESGYIRPLCFFGAEDMGLRADKLKVHVMIAAWSWGAYLGEDALKHGIRVKTASLARHHVNTTMCKAKATGGYLSSILALKEALDCDYDEALMLDTQGFVAEGSGENIFIVRQGTLITPDLTSVLEGITRDTVIELCRFHSIPVVERRITRDEVYIADEAFFTGTAAEITPIRELDGRKIGQGTRGKITEQLQTSYFDVVHGRVERHRSWLSMVTPTKVEDARKNRC